MSCCSALWPDKNGLLEAKCNYVILLTVSPCRSGEEDLSQPPRLHSTGESRGEPQDCDEVSEGHRVLGRVFGHVGREGRG